MKHISLIYVSLCLIIYYVPYIYGSKAESNLYRWVQRIGNTLKWVRFRDLLTNYSSLVRPVRNSTQKLRVAVRFFLQQIVNVVRIKDAPKIIKNVKKCITFQKRYASLGRLEVLAFIRVSFQDEKNQVVELNAWLKYVSLWNSHAIF